MSTEKTPFDFTPFKTVLHFDEETGTNYIKIACEDYQQLGLFRYYVTNAIKLISQMTDIVDVCPVEMGYTVNHLTNILLETSLLGECEGIDKLLK